MTDVDKTDLTYEGFVLRLVQQAQALEIRFELLEDFTAVFYYDRKSEKVTREKFNKRDYYVGWSPDLMYTARADQEEEQLRNGALRKITSTLTKDEREALNRMAQEGKPIRL